MLNTIAATIKFFIFKVLLRFNSKIEIPLRGELASQDHSSKIDLDAL